MGRLRESAFVLISVLGIAIAVGLALSTLAFVSVASMRNLSDEGERLQAFYAADAGIQRTTSLIDARLSTQPDATSELLLLEDILTHLQHLPSTTAPINGQTDSGTFAVTLQPDIANPTTLILHSTGQSKAGTSTRAIQTRLQIVIQNYNLAALAAVTTTGSGVDSGNAPVDGISSTVTGNTLTFSCAHPADSATRCTGSGEPTRYVLTTSSLSAVNPVTWTPQVGDSFTRKGETGTRYSVTAVTSTGIEVMAINEHEAQQLLDTKGKKKVETTFTEQPLSTDESTNLGVLEHLSGVPAVATYVNSGGTNTNGDNTQATCDPATNGGCIYHDIEPDALFETVLGVDKETLYANLPDANKVTSDPLSCTLDVLWITSASNVDLASCPNARLVIIDGRAATSGEYQVKLNTGAFHGLLYVMTDGLPIRFSGNGTFSGAIIAETGTASVNPRTTITGNSSTGVCAGDPQHDPKVCYSPDDLASIADSLKPYVPEAGPQARRVAGAWKEVASQ